MPKYTTGELAKKCGVSVRTVQYYHARDILVPSQLSDGGRRLYSDADADLLKIICFLRELGIPIDSIRQLLQEPEPEKVISVLLAQQEQLLRSEIAQKQRQAELVADTRRALSRLPRISTQSFGDIAQIMERKKSLTRLRIWMLVLGFVMDAIEVSTLMVWIFTGIFWPFVAGMAAAVVIGIWISAVYFTRTVFICPECHGIFRPRLRDSLFARHTPNTRKLTCLHCGHHGFCVETYGKEQPPC